MNPEEGYDFATAAKPHLIPYYPEIITVRTRGFKNYRTETKKPGRLLPNKIYSNQSIISVTDLICPNFPLFSLIVRLVLPTRLNVSICKAKIKTFYIPGEI